MGVDTEGRVAVSSYPERAKSKNAARNEHASMCVLSNEFNGEWVQLDGRIEVVQQPEAIEPLVEYYRSISGEHPNWDEYRQAMVRQGKVLLRLTIERWGPISRGGFPAQLVPQELSSPRWARGASTRTRLRGPPGPAEDPVALTAQDCGRPTAIVYLMECSGQIGAVTNRAGLAEILPRDHLAGGVEERAAAVKWRGPSS